MVACSGIPGNDCKPIPTPIYEFDKYHECIIYGYDYSSQMLKTFEPNTFPKAISYFFLAAARMETTNSGKDVPIAITVRASNETAIFKRAEICNTDSIV